MQEPEHLGDHERRRRRTDKRHSNRFAREVEASTLINAEGQIRGVLVRDLRPVRMLSLSVCFGDIWPEFFGRTRIWPRVQADRVEVLRRTAETAFNDAQEIGSREMSSRRIGIKAAER